MLQIRPNVGPSGPGTPYSPARDLVNAFCRMGQVTCHCLNPDNWTPWLKSYATQTGLQIDDLNRAAQSVAEFVKIARDPEVRDPNAAIRQSGFFDLPEPAKIAFLATLGDVTLMTYWTCSRDALAIGEDPVGLADFEQTVRNNWTRANQVSWWKPAWDYLVTLLRPLFTKVSKVD